jgi:hypothetical protein
MFQLIIKRQDESIYWIEHFNDLPSLNRWLAEEMTRPYWDPTYTHEIVDNTPVIEE